MWIERIDKEKDFSERLLGLERQILIIRGMRQVGKTSFILKQLAKHEEHPVLLVNLLHSRSIKLEGQSFYGLDFFGKSPTGEEFLKNIELVLGNLNALQSPALIFVDEVDRHPHAMSSIQLLAEASPNLKIIFTGSNLENVKTENAATGRKQYFDLYPITFAEFLRAQGNSALIRYFENFEVVATPSSSGKTMPSHVVWAHEQLLELCDQYIRLGGLPKVLSTFLETRSSREIAICIRDLAQTIEENVKTVLGEKEQLYEYEDVLRKLALLSLNTLKFTHLQVDHAGRKEAKRLVQKTVGARVAHKIRLFESDSDLSKYVIADSGLAHYLLCGSHVLDNEIPPPYQSILDETFVANQLIANLISREDLFYWKSGNRAEVEFMMRSPFQMGIDVKSHKGYNRSLNSMALFEPAVRCLIKIGRVPPKLDPQHHAKLSRKSTKTETPSSRTLPLLTLPHYFAGQALSFAAQVLS